MLLLEFQSTVGEELARRLESVSDAEAVREIGVLIIDCADGAETLEAPIPDLHGLQPRAAGPCGPSRSRPGRPGVASPCGDLRYP